MKYSFPAVFTQDPETEGAINVAFPDFFGAYTFGMGQEDALEMAKDLLKLLLMEEDNRKTTPSKLDGIDFADGEVILVEVEL